MENDIEIKTCPWCGNEPEIYSHDDEDGKRVWWYLRCGLDTCPVYPQIDAGYPKRADVIAVWNNRRG